MVNNIVKLSLKYTPIQLAHDISIHKSSRHFNYAQICITSDSQCIQSWCDTIGLKALRICLVVPKTTAVSTIKIEPLIKTFPNFKIYQNISLYKEIKVNFFFNGTSIINI